MPVADTALVVDEKSGGGMDVPGIGVPEVRLNEGGGHGAVHAGAQFCNVQACLFGEGRQAAPRVRRVSSPATPLDTRGKPRR